MSGGGVSTSTRGPLRLLTNHRGHLCSVTSVSTGKGGDWAFTPRRPAFVLLISSPVVFFSD